MVHFSKALLNTSSKLDNTLYQIKRLPCKNTKIYIYFLYHYQLSKTLLVQQPYIEHMDQYHLKTNSTVNIKNRIFNSTIKQIKILQPKANFLDASIHTIQIIFF